MVQINIENWSVNFFNSLFFLSCLPETFRFFLKSINPRKTQLGILKRLIELNLNTDFGEEYSFKNIRCYRDFCEKVPETDYEFLKKYISLISSGRNNVLTSDTVLLFEPSSGTTTDSKLIPYTTSLKNEFQRGIYPWIADMYFKNPGLLSGKSYWSISPVIKKESSESGITIGFEDDSEYFSPLMRFFLRRIFAVPDIVRNCSDLKVFKYTTLLFLLRTKNLCFISIWSPTFLLSLLKPVSEWYKALVHDIRFGTFSPPCNVEPSFKKGIKKYLYRDKKRAKELLSHFNKKEGYSFSDIWPKLDLISVWMDASARFSLDELFRKFPGIKFQAKGLLATEGIISIPFYDGKCVLAINSHFLEFVEVDVSKKSSECCVVLCDQLQIGKRYSILLTTGGGLYRYRIRDIIEIKGFVNKLPVVEFVGKEGNVSDMVGEKLDSIFVEYIIDSILKKYELDAEFVLVSPEKSDDHFSYTVFIKCCTMEGALFDMIAEEIDQKFCSNIHYSYARKIGQLGEVRFFLLEDPVPMDIYIEHFNAKNMKAGDIKPLLLSVKPGWLTRFSGKLLKSKCNSIE